MAPLVYKNDADAFRLNPHSENFSGLKVDTLMRNLIYASFSENRGVHSPSVRIGAKLLTENVTIKNGPSLSLSSQLSYNNSNITDNI